MKTFDDFNITVPIHANGEVDVTCPACSAQRKKKRARCLSVNTTKGTWLCHHCGWHGSLLEGVKRHSELHWQKPTYVRPEPRTAADDLDVAMVQWFAKRGISAPTLRRNKISIQEVYMPQVEERVRAISFPYYRDGEYINAKFRDKDKNFRMEAGAERVLYGLDDLLAPDGKCIIVEGEIDKLSIEEAGITACVSVPDGAPSIDSEHYQSKFKFIDSDIERLDKVGKWIIAVDNDPPGARLEEELVRRFGVERCLRATWPEGCKDANDVLRKHGKDKLRECIENAQEYPIHGVITASMLSREVELLYERGESRGVSTGWALLDEYYTVQEGEVTVVTGTPGAGKSNWIDALITRLAKNQHWIVPIFSPENRPLYKHISRLMEKFVREPFRHGPTPRMSKARMQEALEWIDFHFPMISPEDEREWTLQNIIEIAERLVRRLGIKGLVIDPWNELEHQRPPHMTESEYVGKSLRTIRQFAARNKLHVWIVAHPAKLYRNKDGTYPTPSLYDISGSANWFNKIDNGLVLYRAKASSGDDPVVKLYIQKVRLRDTGHVGEQDFRYDRVLADYEAIDPNDPSGRTQDRWSAPQ